MSKDILEEVDIWNDPDNYDYRCYDKACELVGRLSGHLAETREQLAEARREGKAEGIRLGWEQCKAEMMLWIRNNGCGDVGLNKALSSMIYKEAQDEHNS